MKKLPEKLKIAMLGHKHVPSREGGVEIVVEELSKRMVERGHSVTLYNRSSKSKEGKDRKKEKEYKWIKLKYALTIDKKGFAAMTSSLFASIRIAFSRYDVVHYHAEGPAAMLWIPKLFRKRCIVTIHGLDWQRDKWSGFARKYIKFGEKTAVRFADAIIVLSKNVEEYFLSEYGRKTVFIPNGITKPEILNPNLIKDKWNLNKDNYILFLGRLVPEKGVDLLIKAFKDIKTDKRLVIAGFSSDTDEYQKELKELSKADERIIFTGFVEGRTLAELYSNSYLYVLPSNLEGMPLSLLEAMSYRNCCLTSDIKECTEVIENKGITFQKGNIKDLKEKLQELINTPSIVESYKKEAQGFILNKYNWEEIADKTLNIYYGRK